MHTIVADDNARAPSRVYAGIEVPQRFYWTTSQPGKGRTDFVIIIINIIRTIMQSTRYNDCSIFFFNILFFVIRIDLVSLRYWFR